MAKARVTANNGVESNRIGSKRAIISTKKKPQWVQSFLFCLFGLAFLLSLAIFFVVNDNALSNGNSMKTNAPESVFKTEQIPSIIQNIPVEAAISISTNIPQKKPVITDILPVFATDLKGFPDKHIVEVPGGKTGLRQNYRIYITDENNGADTRPGSVNDRNIQMQKRKEIKLSNISLLGEPWGYIEARNSLKNHIIYNEEHIQKNNEKKMSLEEIMLVIKGQELCKNVPIFLTMATVGDPLYWQLIENFVFSAVKFEVNRYHYILIEYTCRFSNKHIIDVYS
jgi:hypothetical protein